MFTLFELIKIVFEKPGTFWILGNITPAGALFTLITPFLVGFCLASLGAWLVSRKKVIKSSKKDVDFLEQD